MALGHFSLKFSGSFIGRPRAVSEGRQAAPMLQVHKGLLGRTLRVIHYVFVIHALMGLSLSSVSSMEVRKGGFLNHMA